MGSVKFRGPAGRVRLAKAAEGRTQSKTLRACGATVTRASVLDCAQPSGAFFRPPIRVRSRQQRATVNRGLKASQYDLSVGNWIATSPARDERSYYTSSGM